MTDEEFWALEPIVEKLLITKEMLEQEQYALIHDNKLYLECIGPKLLKDRITDQEIRDGMIRFNSVYKSIKCNISYH